MDLPLDSVVWVFLLPAWKTCHNYILILRTGLGKGYWWNVCSLLYFPAKEFLDCLFFSFFTVFILRSSAEAQAKHQFLVAFFLV